MSLDALMRILAPRVLPGRAPAVERIAADLVRDHDGPLESLVARAVLRAGAELSIAPSSLDPARPLAIGRIERRWRSAFELQDAIPPQIHDGLPSRWSQQPLSRETVLDWWATWIERRDAGRAPSRLQAYVHVPWCRTRCGFCQYEVILSRDEAAMEAGVRAVENEARAFAGRLGAQRAHAVTIGGGTPSALTPALLARTVDALLGVIVRESDDFFSVELNPDSCTAAKLRVLVERGANRVSLGVQSFDPSTLRRVQRGYQTEAMVVDAVREARRVGPLQISLDLLAPLVGETAASFERGASRAFELEPDQLVLYRYEPVTRGGVRMEPGSLPFETARDLLLAAVPSSYRRVPNTGETVVLEHRDARAFRTRYLQHDRQPSSMLGLGPFAESHVFDVGDYVGSRLEDSSPYHGHRLAPREERARFIGRHLGGGLAGIEADYRAAFGTNLHDDYGAELAFLDEHGPPMDVRALQRVAWLFVDESSVAAVDESRTRGASERDRRWLERSWSLSRVPPIVSTLVDVRVGAHLGTSTEAWFHGRAPIEAQVERADVEALEALARELGLQLVADVLARAWIEGMLEAPRVHVVGERTHVELPLASASDVVSVIGRRLDADLTRARGRPSAVWIDSGRMSLALGIAASSPLRARLPAPLANAILTLRLSLHDRGGTWIALVGEVPEPLRTRIDGVRAEPLAIELTMRSRSLDDAVLLVVPRSRPLLATAP